MKTFNTGVAELVFVEVPKGADSHHLLEARKDMWFLQSLSKDLLGVFPMMQSLLLGSGKFEILGLSHELTEEQCRGLVNFDYPDREDLGYKEYGGIGWYFFAKESLQSAITASGIEQREGYNVLVLKKMK